MRSLLLALVTALGVTLACGGPDARADARADGRAPAPSQGGTNAAAVGVEVIILHATNDGNGIDPRIGKIPALSKPPFSSYNSYKLLNRVSHSLEKGKSGTIKLPTARDLLVTYKDVLEPKKKDEAKKFIVTASIQKPDGKSFLPLIEFKANPAEWFFVAGQEYKGGSLVIGFKVNP